jgi:hypothetical protein
LSFSFLPEDAAAAGWDDREIGDALAMMVVQSLVACPMHCANCAKGTSAVFGVGVNGVWAIRSFQPIGNALSL